MASNDTPPLTANDPSNNGPSSVPEKLGDMFKVGFMVDCKFIVGKSAETIFGHKWMFAVESPVFERMFCGDFMEAKNATEIKLPDDNPKTFRILRRILYKTRDADVSSLSFEDTISLYKMCDKYMVESISKLCCEHLINFDDTEELIELFGVASEYQDSSLLDDVKEKLGRVSYPLSFEELSDLKETQFMDYILLYVNTNKAVNHIDLFRTIEYYFEENEILPKYLLDAVETEPESNANAAADKIDSDGKTMETEEQQKEVKDTPDNQLLSEERKRELLELLLVLVDFGTMTTNQFLDGPGASKILTFQQKYFVLTQLAKNPCKNCYRAERKSIKLLFQAK